MNGDPPRWADGTSGAPEAVQRLLEAARGDAATDTELALLAERLAPVLAVPAAAGAGAAASGKALLAKIAVASGAALVIGGTVLATRTAAPVAPAVATQVVQQPVNASPPKAEPPRTVETVTSATEAEHDEVTGSASARAKQAPLKHEAASPAPPRQAESELLGQAQSALAANPAYALRLAEEHRRTFSRGVLVQEREVIAIEALRRLGRAREASGRAERFLSAYPGSAHRSKVLGFIDGR